MLSDDLEARIRLAAEHAANLAYPKTWMESVRADFVHDWIRVHAPLIRDRRYARITTSPPELSQ